MQASLNPTLRKKNAATKQLMRLLFSWESGIKQSRAHGCRRKIQPKGRNKGTLVGKTFTDQLNKRALLVLVKMMRGSTVDLTDLLVINNLGTQRPQQSPDKVFVICYPLLFCSASTFVNTIGGRCRTLHMLLQEGNDIEEK